MIKLYSRNKHRQQGTARRPGGFTIIELLIATSIFSVVLLVALNGFFQIGKIYYKGVATSQTQSAAQKVIEDISSALQFAPGVGIASPTLISGTTYYMCIGDARYTYVQGRQVNPATEDTSNLGLNKFGLLRDYLSGTGCVNPLSGGLKNPTELLGNKMRLSNLCLLQITGKNSDTDISACTTPSPCSGGTPAAPCLNNLFLINIKIAYGDDDILNAATSTNPSCNTTLSNSQYCSVANLQTVINRGYGN